MKASCSDQKEKRSVLITSTDLPAAAWASGPSGLPFHFDRVSAGYLGLPCPNATLNSRFFYLLQRDASQITLDATLLPFPQRVPRLGFFSELWEVETKEAREAFVKIRKSFESRLLALGSPASLSRSDKILWLNLSDILARYGALSFLGRMEALIDVRDELDLLIATQQKAFQVSLAVSLSHPVDLAPLADLVRHALANDIGSPRAQASLINRLLVSSIRYADPSEERQLAFSLAPRVLHYLESPSQSSGASLSEALFRSVLWRGLAMWSERSSVELDQYLQNALSEASSMVEDNETSRILKHELLMTLYQTLSKWHTSQGRAEEGLRILLQMTELDPSDSTAFSELGLACFHAEKYAEALTHFSAAVELGPPGLALNWHFKGLCELKMEALESAQASFAQSAQVDPQALSPRLELYRVFVQSGYTEKASLVREQILTNADLVDQLTEAEVHELRNA